MGRQVAGSAGQLEARNPLVLHCPGMQYKREFRLAVVPSKGVFHMTLGPRYHELMSQRDFTISVYHCVENSLSRDIGAALETMHCMSDHEEGWEESETETKQ
uniref:Uncharacterized protein n=1 Tax=Sphaerodactylus townsendi TaxID=933632 RepID=A0ACB8EBP9_9SAUR